MDSRSALGKTAPHSRKGHTRHPQGRKRRHHLSSHGLRQTEAAFLPIGSLLITKPASSLGALCLSPLKALINNQAERLAGIFRDTGVPVTAWHGDAGWETKRNFLECPRGILLITPESLETLLMRHNTWCRAAFSDLRCVVIDEFHDFLSGERGWQTQSLLKRIESKVHRPVPRIALSATLGDIGETENFLRPGRGDYPCAVIDDEKTAARPVIQVRGYTHHFRSPWAKDQAPRDERLIQDLFTLLGGKTISSSPTPVPAPNRSPEA